MKCICSTFLALAIVPAFLSAADVEINFEDVTGELMAPIPNGYNGLNWQNLWVLDTVDYENDSGYKQANTSGDYVAFNFDWAPGVITSSDPIVVKSFWITSGWHVGLSATIQGSLQGDVKYTLACAPSPYAPLLVTMDVAPYDQPVDQLVFNAFGGYSVFPGGHGPHFAIDDLVFSVVVDTITAALDIRPQECPNILSLNLRSNGRLPVAILGSDSFDVSQIDVDTISIDGTAFPVKSPSLEDETSPVQGDECACHISAPDGFDDLKVHFSIREVILALGLDTMPNGEVVPITVEGQLLDGTPFKATDCVTLTAP